MSDLVKVKSVVKLNSPEIGKITEAAVRALELTAAALQTEVVQAQVVPRMDGTLQGEAFFVDTSESREGRASLVHNTPYARRLYYHPEYHFHREAWSDSRGNHDGNPNAKGHWFEDWQPGGEKEEFAADAFAEFLRMEAGL